MPNTPQDPNRHNEHRRPECLLAESSYADALDRGLSPAERARFELHLNACAECSRSYAEAQRGHAWLEMLKHPRPQPRPELLAGILARTSGAEPQLLSPAAGAAAPVALLPEAGRLLAFPPRTAPATVGRLSRLLLEPRLAMTAAMAFFSVTLTMSLTGVRLDQFHASDLSPSGLRRGAHGLEAGAVRYYDNLLVVHVLESRADDLREDLRQRQQEPLPAATPAEREQRPAPVKPAAPAPRGGSSSNRPQGNQAHPSVAWVAALLAPWAEMGGRA